MTERGPELTPQVEVSGEAEVVRGPHHVPDCRCDEDEPDTSNCDKNEEDGR